MTGKKSKKKPKIVKKSTLDKLWSLKIKERAGFKCEICGTTENLNSHHIIGRRNHAVRWFLPNGICLCVQHHMGSLSAHQNSPWFMAELVRIRGVDSINDLMIKAREIFKWKKNTEEIKEQLNDN
jgi:predicted restriction endonuclease